MATQVGPKYPTTSADLGDGGFKGSPYASWSNLTNIYAADGNTAAGQEVNGGDSTSTIKAGGFDFSSVPDAATIAGILVEINVSGYQSAEGSLSISNATKGSVGNKMVGNGVPSSAATIPYGGSTDTWGQSWTGADLKTNFFLYVNWQNTHGGGQVNVDFIRITVWWNPPPKPQDINQNKTYLYKSYDNTGQFLGLVPGVANDYSHSQDINTTGGQITIEIAQSIDTASVPATEVLTDESGATLTDESGSPLLTEGAINLTSLGTGAALIKNGNRIVVWEYSYYWPNGHIVFRGKIERWEAPFGGGDEQNITAYVYNDGSDLDNYLITGSPYVFTQDQAQTTQNASDTITQSNGDKFVGWNYWGQSWTVGGSVATNVGAISLLLNGTADVTVKIYDGPGQLNLLATTTQHVAAGGATEIQFALSNHILVNGGTQLFFTVEVPAGQSIVIYYANNNPYAAGQSYVAQYSGTSGGGYVANSGSDLYFKTFSSSGSTTATFSNQDPTNGMLKTFMGDYGQRGGLISFTNATIDTTGLSLSYKFNTNTVAEGIEAIRTISPAPYYYYVDLGTNLLYFKNTSTTPDILLVKGRHLEQVEMVASIENVKNTDYGSFGQPTAGVNLYKSYQDAASVALYGQRLDRQSDNHVTDGNTATAIVTSHIADLKDEQYATVVTVLDKTMDTSLIRVGQMVGFRGFGTFVDKLVLQIVRVDYSRDECKLTLGNMAKRQGTDLEQIIREVIALQTIDNPTTPS